MTKTPINFSAASLLGCWAVALWLGGKTALMPGGQRRCGSGRWPAGDCKCDTRMRPRRGCWQHLEDDV